MKARRGLRIRNGLRVVQFTPPGSRASIQFATEVTPVAPGSAQNLYLVVADIMAARAQLVARGVGVGEVLSPWGRQARISSPTGSSTRLGGPSPDHTSCHSFATFRDPDGNSWLFQEVTTRLPGRVERAETAFASVNDLASALRRAATTHGEHEKRLGQHDANWPDWYAAYLVAEQAGDKFPQ